MSLFDRLSKIVRAELGIHHNHEIPIDEVYTAEGLKNPSSNSTKDPVRNHDPRIAGFYANLEVPYGSDIETVRKGWKKMVRKYHPDLHSSDTQKVKLANEIVQGLNKAYEELENHLRK